MGKQTNVLHGSCSEVFINGVRDELATKIEVKVTGDFEDATFCGEYGTFPIYNGYTIEGTVTDKKKDSALETAIAEGYLTTLIGALQAATAVVLNAYYSKSKTENQKGGITYESAAASNFNTENDL